MDAIRKIESKVKVLDIGKALNYIQKVAWNTLTKKSINRFSKALGNDLEECDGMDGLLVNGDYYDWKEFEWNKQSILHSFLRYFTENELEKIAQAI